MEHGTCDDCGVATYRRGRCGPHPKRCPDHSAAYNRARGRRTMAAWRATHPEHQERARAAYAVWYEANAGHARDRALRWYYGNADRARETNARWYRENVDKSRAKTQRRRAARKRVDAERFTPQEIYDRDGWICQICHQPVDPECAWPNPWSPSLDHIVALVHGGPHTRTNTRLAHLICNTRRGAALI